MLFSRRDDCVSHKWLRVMRSALGNKPVPTQQQSQLELHLELGVYEHPQEYTKLQPQVVMLSQTPVRTSSWGTPLGVGLISKVSGVQEHRVCEHDAQAVARHSVVSHSVGVPYGLQQTCWALVRRGEGPRRGGCFGRVRDTSIWT